MEETLLGHVEVSEHGQRQLIKSCTQWRIDNMQKFVGYVEKSKGKSSGWYSMFITSALKIDNMDTPVRHIMLFVQEKGFREGVHL